MALMKCSECGKEISQNAVVCPHCGNPNQLILLKRNKTIKIVCDITGLLGLLFFGGFIISFSWAIGFAIASSASSTKYNNAYYKKLSKDNFITAALVLFLNLFLLMVFGNFSVFGMLLDWMH